MVQFVNHMFTLRSQRTKKDPCNWLSVLTNFNNECTPGHKHRETYDFLATNTIRPTIFRAKLSVHLIERRYDTMEYILDLSQMLESKLN